MPLPEWEIRPMQETDVSQIYEIEKVSFAKPWSKNSILHDITENVVARWLVLEEKNGTILAYASVWLIIDEGHICNVAVHPDYRALGFGRIILDALIKLAKDEGMRLMTLEVRRSNEIAQRLYHSLGFRDVGYRKRYYEDNREDALIMFLDLI